MRTHLHIHTKPPSGQGLTLTLKGLCLAPVIATPQAGFVVSISTSTPLCVYERARVVCETATYGVNSRRHPRHLEPDCRMGLCACVHCGLFFVWTTEKQQQFHRQCSGKQNNCAFDGVLFVVVGRQEMRSCWGLWLCARRAYRRAGPGRAENTNHLLAGLAGLMEMRNSSFSAVYQSKVESVVTPGTAISLTWF